MGTVPCDYYGEFDKPKIVVQCIAYFSQFALDNDGYLINNKAILIPTDDLYVLAVLNSRIVWWIVSRVFQHMKDEGLSVDVQFLVNLPIPNAPVPLMNQIRGTTARLLSVLQNLPPDSGDLYSLEHGLSRMIEEAFELSPREREVLVKTLPPRDPLTIFENRGLELGRLGCDVHVGRIVFFIILLLRTWKKPAVRNVLEAALVLMLNDGARRQILGRSGTPVSAWQQGQAPEFVRGLDGLLQDIQITGFVEITTLGGRQAIRVGASAPLTDNAPAPDVERLQETLKALEIVGEDQALVELEGIVHERYAVVP